MINGKPIATFESPWQHQGLAFANQRLDSTSVASPAVSHCHFVDVSFKEAEIRGGEFLNCRFEGVYFRQAELSNVRFIGCHFIDCNFNHTQIQGCSFDFSTFSGCHVPFDEMLSNLPRQKKIRMGVCRSLAQAAASRTYTSDASKYKLEMLNSRRGHLRAVIAQKESYYKSKYQAWDRVLALLDLSLLMIASTLWGHGERLRNLILTTLFLGLILGPFSLFLVRDGFNERPSTLSDYILLSIDALLPAGEIATYSPTTATASSVLALLGLLGVVVFGLFVSFLVKSISRT